MSAWKRHHNTIAHSKNWGSVLQKSTGSIHARFSDPRIARLRDLGLIYLASPYTKYTAGHVVAASEVAKLAGFLLERGISLFCPIAHAHYIAHEADIIALDHRFWLDVDRPLMDKCDALLVSTMRGWDESVGVRYEMLVFRKQGKPIYLIDPITLELKDYKCAQSQTAA